MMPSRKRGRYDALLRGLFQDRLPCPLVSLLRRDRVLTARVAGEAVVDHLHRARKHGPRSNAYLWYGLPQEQAVRERMYRKRERERIRKIEEGLTVDFGTYLFNLGADMARIRGAA